MDSILIIIMSQNMFLRQYVTYTVLTNRSSMQFLHQQRDSNTSHQKSRNMHKNTETLQQTVWQQKEAQVNILILGGRDIRNINHTQTNSIPLSPRKFWKFPMIFTVRCFLITLEHNVETLHGHVQLCVPIRCFTSANFL